MYIQSSNKRVLEWE